MKILKKLIRLHKFLFFAAMLFTLLSVFLNLYWNSFLADTIDRLESIFLLDSPDEEALLLTPLAMAEVIIFFHTAAEYLSSCLASFTCEVFAHEMRMGYSRFYLQRDIRTLSKLKVGEEQSAMQNEIPLWRKNFWNGKTLISRERGLLPDGLMSLSGLLSFVPLLLLLAFGGAMVIKGEISIGLFYIFIILSGNVSGFLQNMPNIYAAFRRFEATVGRLGKKLVLRDS